MRDEWHEWLREYRASWLREYRTSLQERLLDDVMFNLQEPIHRHSTNKKMHTPTRDVGDNPPNERPYCSSITSLIAAASRALRIARLRTRHFAASDISSLTISSLSESSIRQPYLAPPRKVELSQITRAITGRGCRTALASGRLRRCHKPLCCGCRGQCNEYARLRLTLVHPQ